MLLHDNWYDGAAKSTGIESLLLLHFAGSRSTALIKNLNKTLKSYFLATETHASDTEAKS